MRDAAIAGGGIAAHRLRAGALAGPLGRTELDADGVPGAAIQFATEGVEGADGVAALGVVAERRRVWLAAGTGAGVAAVGNAVADRKLASGSGTAEIPLTVAAEGIALAHGVAALLIVAGGELMLGAAGTGCELAALRRLAKAGATASALRERDAGGVPHGGAADRVGGADRIAALTIGAGRRRLREEAASAVRDAAERTAAILGETRAEAVPLRAAAEGVDHADRIAAGAVVAEGLVVGFEAGAGAPVAAADRATADGAGEEGALVVPEDGAAIRIDRADARAAGFVIAAGVGVAFEAAADAGAAPLVVGQAAGEGVGDAVAVPGLDAADGVDRADDVAARWVFAAR